VTRPTQPSGFADRRPAARLAAVGALAIACVVVAVVLLRGGDESTYRIVLPNANQLVDGNEVQVGGRRVGLVIDIRLTDDSRAEIELRIDDDALLPLRRGTTADVRAPSLSGIANKVVSLTPGPGNAAPLADGDRLPAEDVTPNVDLDQIFNAFDPETRRGYQRFVKGGSGMLRGRERDAREGLRYFSTALQAGTRLVDDVTADQPALVRFLRSTSAVVGTLARERDALTGVVPRTRATVGALADERAALERTLDRLPGSLRRASTTFAGVRGALDDLDPLIRASRPVADKAGPLLRELRPLAADLVPTIAATRRLIDRPGAGNDLLELLALTPGLAEVAVPALRDAAKAATDQRPQVAFTRPYVPELTGWARTFGGATAGYDAHGHVARTQLVLNTNSLVDAPAASPLRPLLGALTPAIGAYTQVDRTARRCPGANAQTLADRSNPWRDADGSLDCDPKGVLPGP